MNNSYLLGIFYGLLSSMTWAIGIVCLKTQIAKAAPLSINFVRSGFGCIFYLVAFLITGEWRELTGFETLPLIMIFATVLIGGILGESLYISSMRFGSVSRVTPIFWSYPVITTFLAGIFLGEQLTWFALLGAIFVVIGVGLISSKEELKDKNNTSERVWMATLLAIGSAFAWGIGTTIIKISVEGGSPLAVSALMVWVNTIVLLFLPIHIPRTISLLNLDKQFLTNIAIAGFIGGMGLTSLFYVWTVREIGAGKAAVLGATAPLFTALLAFLLIKETLNRNTMIGILLVVLGVSINVFPH
jgi:drug/metabolite transporter (DMT)-like permease